MLCKECGYRFIPIWTHTERVSEDRFLNHCYCPVCGEEYLDYELDEE